MPTLKRTKFMSATVLLFSIGTTAYGLAPSSNDPSDANANTGVGSFRAIKDAIHQQISVYRQPAGVGAGRRC